MPSPAQVSRWCCKHITLQRPGDQPDPEPRRLHHQAPLGDALRPGRAVRRRGDYPNQHPGGADLPAYTAADRPLENTDLVVWYTFGAHHIVRPEDWPVAPVHYIGFHLKPAGFFDGNPALDLPPSHNGHACHE